MVKYVINIERIKADYQSVKEFCEEHGLKYSTFAQAYGLKLLGKNKIVKAVDEKYFKKYYDDDDKLFVLNEEEILKTYSTLFQFCKMFDLRPQYVYKRRPFTKKHAIYKNVLKKYIKEYDGNKTERS